jgi:putative ABC transport system ATP-binding protein
MDNTILQLEGIRKSYFLGKQELPVLKGISMNISKNDYVALMGPSGSGKVYAHEYSRLP